MSLKHRIENLKSELTELRSGVKANGKTAPLRKILDIAFSTVEHALYEAMRVDDPTENAMTCGTGQSCLCPHCGHVIPQVFDEVYMEGEHYDMHCPECEVPYTVLVDKVFALLNIQLDDSGVCQGCFHWEHASGKCEPYSVKCACQENTE